MAVLRRDPECIDCGAVNPWLRDMEKLPDGRWRCRHRYACEARQMLARGEFIEKVAEHAQKPRPW